MLIDAFNFVFCLNSLEKVEPLFVVPLLNLPPILALLDQPLILQQKPLKHPPYQQTRVLIPMHEAAEKPKR